MRAVKRIQGGQSRESACGSHLEDCARRTSVKISVAGQKQASLRHAVSLAGEGKESGKRAIGSYFEHGADIGAATLLSGAVKLAVSAGGQFSERNRAVGAIERDQGGKDTVGRDFEDCAKIRGAAVLCRSIEILVGSKRQSSLPARALGRLKQMEGGEASSWSHLKNRPSVRATEERG